MKDNKQQYHTHARWLKLSEQNDDENVIHGVALPPDTTAETSDDKVHFPSDEIEQAADKLAGEAVSRGHPDEWPYPVEETIGRVTKSEWNPELGLVYQATLTDDDIAEKVDAGILDVSAHVMSNDGPENDDGAVTATDLDFAGLGVVSKGAAYGNTAETGPLEAPLEAVTETLGYDGPHDGTGPESGGADDQSTTTQMDNEELEDRLEELETELDERKEREKELEEEKEKFEERISTLEAEKEESEQEIKMEYAEALAETSPISAETLATALSFEDLKSDYDEAVESGDISTVAPTEPSKPDVQSGGGSDDDSLTEDERERVEELEGEIDQLQDKSTDFCKTMVEAREKELKELRGEK